MKFYTTCLDCYCETREIVYLKIAAALLRECSVDLEPEFDKYISFEASGRNKSFILSTFAILLEQNRYKEEIQAVVNSEYWNCSSVENEILKMLAWCCSDDLNDDSLTGIENAQFKRDYLRCIKNYPEIDVEYARNRTDAIYRSNCYQRVREKVAAEGRNLPNNIKVCLIPGDEMNAYCFGARSIGVTEGALNLDNRTVEAIIAHELGHLTNGDSVLNMVLIVNCLGIIAVLAFYQFAFCNIYRNTRLKNVESVF